MVDPSIVVAKLTELEVYLQRVEQALSSLEEPIDKDSVHFQLLSFNLLLALQICVDIATHIVADEKWALSSPWRSLLEDLKNIRSFPQR